MIDGAQLGSIQAAVVLGLAGVQLLMFAIAADSILGSARYRGGGKALWLLFVFVWPFAGPLWWLVVGRGATGRSPSIE